MKSKAGGSLQASVNLDLNGVRTGAALWGLKKSRGELRSPLEAPPSARPRRGSGA